MNELSSLNSDIEDLSHIRVLLTGASGYIGRNLLNRLIQLECQVSVITRNKERFDCKYQKLNLIEYDLSSTSDALPDTSGFDVIFNCAGELKDPSKMQGVHVDGTMRLLESVRNRKLRWVQLSSVGVYGQNVVGEIKEEHPFHPVGAYESTKAEAEKKVRSYCLKYNIPYSILRPSNIFSFDMTNKSLEKWVELIRSGWFFKSNQHEYVKSNYVHIDNVVDALLLCGFHKNTANQDFIISDSLPQTKFVAAICEELQAKQRNFIYPYSLAIHIATLLSPIFGKGIERKLKALNTRVVYSTRKLENLTGYRNKINLETAIREYAKTFKV